MSNGAVGFIGLGSMGSAMAENLLKYVKEQGRRLYVWNRSPEKVVLLADKGAVRCETIAEMASQCSVVMTMMGDDAALQSVFGSYIEASSHPEGAIFVDHSTVAPKLTSSLAEQAATKGIKYVSSPVFGRPAAAAAKQLLVMAAGDTAAKNEVRALLEAMGRGVVDLGDTPAQGSVMKLVGNFYISSLIEVFAEGMALGEKNGVSPTAIAQVAGQLFPGPIAPGYADRIAKGEFQITPSTPGFALTGGMKDVGHVLQLGKDSGVCMPVADIVMSHLQSVKESPDGGANLDWGAVALAVREAAGLQ